jgi:hypothetical protein
MRQAIIFLPRSHSDGRLESRIFNAKISLVIQEGNVQLVTRSMFLRRNAEFQLRVLREFEEKVFDGIMDNESWSFNLEGLRVDLQVDELVVIGSIKIFWFFKASCKIPFYHGNWTGLRVKNLMIQKDAASKPQSALSPLLRCWLCTFNALMLIVWALQASSSSSFWSLLLLKADLEVVESNHLKAERWMLLCKDGWRTALRTRFSCDDIITSDMCGVQAGALIPLGTISIPMVTIVDFLQLWVTQQGFSHLAHCFSFFWLKIANLPYKNKNFNLLANSYEILLTRHFQKNFAFQHQVKLHRGIFDYRCGATELIHSLA